MNAAGAGAPSATRSASWALLLGNFAIGCGVLVAPASLNDIVQSLAVSVSLGGQLVTLGAVTMGAGAPLLAVMLGGWDRRRLLVLSLLWFGLGHAACALAPSYAALMPLRALTVLGAAVFTPQAAAAIGVLSDPAQRGRAISFVFLGWSLASVIGMPVAALVAETAGWRWAFALVALLSVAAALGVWRTVPDGVRPPKMDLRQWRATLADPFLMGIVAVTALSAAGQFTLFTYLAPYYRQVLGVDASGVSALFFWFGLFGLIGNVALTRVVDRAGAARCATVALVLMAITLALWPLAGGVTVMALILVPWGLGVFAANSAQQARLSDAAPARAQALMALNTSAIYVGQGLGAAGGGAMAAAAGLTALWPLALAWMGLAVMLSARLPRRSP